MDDAVNQQERRPITEEFKWFMAGFIEGEGSFTVSIKPHPTQKFRCYIDPDFYLYQHKNRRGILEMAREMFGTGNIYPKPGNENVLTFHISSRRSVCEKILPFIEKYMKFSYKRKTLDLYKEIVLALENKEHSTVSGMLRIIDMAYEMNPEGKVRKRPKQEVIDLILRDHTPKSQEAT